MSEPIFIGYVGIPEIHDGTILRVTHEADVVRVSIQAYSERRFVIEFRGVAAVEANRSEGMLLYALSEWEGVPPLRRFVFANWDDKDDASLLLTAQGYRMLEESDC